MTYAINKSDGTKLVDILDGTIDQTTDLKLIGKNSITFGEALNEDLVFLLENFSNSRPPNRPITGQLWYNTAESRLQVYTGVITGWRATGAPVVSQDQPINLITGDFWINSYDKQLYFYDGSALTLAGPIWKNSQGKTGFIAETLFDEFNNPKPVLQLFVNNSLLGIFSSAEFVPSPSLTGFSSIGKGYTASSAVSTTFNVETINSQKLAGISGNNYLRRDINSTMNGKLSISSNLGITIGSTSNVDFKVSGFALQIENTKENGDIAIISKNSGGSNSNIYINATTGYVGILTNTPQNELDVNGDVRIRGNLEVDGKVISAPVSLTLIDNDILGDVNGYTVSILNDVASTDHYLNNQLAVVHYQHIGVSGASVSITRYLRQFVISNGTWTFDTNLTSSV